MEKQTVWVNGKEYEVVPGCNNEGCTDCPPYLRPIPPQKTVTELRKEVFQDGVDILNDFISGRITPIEKARMERDLYERCIREKLI